MQELTKLLNQQKEQIEKDLEQNGHDMYTIKLQEARLKKMLKNVNAQLSLTTEEPKK